MIENHEGTSENLHGILLHIVADTLGSVGVIISTLLLKWTGWSGWDAVASIVISVLI
ncbi:cation transporter, partial [Mycobacterium tuberculosis]|uniref:cation transporter n=1 Tax=Mycobacterium tuberculosis TaxID=1773 RepID=UPI001AE9BF06|nr:cation transporter [Mycobacterium tuberculosis]